MGGWGGMMMREAGGNVSSLLIIHNGYGFYGIVHICTKVAAVLLFINWWVSPTLEFRFQHATSQLQAFCAIHLLVSHGQCIAKMRKHLGNCDRICFRQEWNN